MDNLIKLNIKGISYSQTQTGAYALILEEKIGGRKLPIIIGSFEAQSIALALEKDINPPRPLTHDLFVSLGKKFHLYVDSIYIYKLEDGVFYSNIVFLNGEGERAEIDSRTSDAIALALRFNAPIFTYKNILDKAGIYLSINPSENAENQENDDILSTPETFGQEDVVVPADSYSGYSLKELYEKLDEAVQNEDYEKAAKIRDEISKKES